MFFFWHFPLYICSPSPFSSPPFPSSSFLSSSLSLLFPFFLLSLSLLLFLFCTSLLIPFPPSFLKYFFGLCSIFLFPISFWSVCLSFSFSHFCFFCYSFIKILLLVGLWCTVSDFGLFTSFVLPFHPPFPRVYFQLSLHPLSIPFFPLLFSSTLWFLFHHFPLLHCFHISLSYFSYSFSPSISPTSSIYFRSIFITFWPLSCHWLRNQMSPPPLIACLLY